MSTCSGSSCACSSSLVPAPRPVGVVPAGAERSLWRIAQMDCPTEEGLLRRQLEPWPEVYALEFNLLERVLTVSHVPGAQAKLAAAIRALGMTPTPLEQAAQAAPAAPAWPWSLAVAALAALGAESAHLAGLPVWVEALAALAAVAICGLGTYRKGWIALRHLEPNINALMSVAVTGAMALGEWSEAAMVMVLFALAERLEARSLDRARNAIHGLLLMTPPTATILDAEGAWTSVSADSVPLAATVRVGPGEAIPLDGQVLTGRSAVNQAAITGESLPVAKTAGDPVFAGTLNLTGAFDFRVTALAGDTTLARITHAIEAAQATRAPFQGLVDRFARVYTPTVLGLALLIALLPPLLLGGAWSVWAYRALVLLVISCPCALVISTPVTLISGLAACSRHGILVKGGRFLEQGRNLTWIAFDKTGTLTRGEPVVTDLAVLGALDEPALWDLTVSLASRSDHPLSRALAAARPQAARAEVTEFSALPGLGIQGHIAGQVYTLGNHQLIENLGLCSPALEARLAELEQAGKTTLMLADAHGVQALFALADAVKPSSRAAVAALHALGLRTLMLTGDNAHTAQAIAAQVGIDEVLGGQLPEHKAQAIRAKLATGAKVAMVGDGINDGPALAAADLGFAMGAAGSDTAIETADVALMDDDLGKLATFIRLSRATYQVLLQNLVLAVGIKAGFLALTILGHGSLWLAVFADMGASLLVVLNGLRILRK